AFLPECLGVFRVERITAYTFADRCDSHIIWNYLAYVAVLAILSADLVSRCNHRGPYWSCRALWNGLELKRALALFRSLLSGLIDHLLDCVGAHMPAQFGLNASRMDSRRAHAIPVALIEGNREKDIGCLRPAVGNEWIIRRPLKVGIREIHIRKAVTGRRKVDQPSAFAEKRCNAVHQDEVPEVIGAELGLEPIGSVAKGCGHNSGVSDNRIEGF